MAVAKSALFIKGIFCYSNKSQHKPTTKTMITHNYHPSVHYFQRRDFPGMFEKLPEDFRVIVDKIRSGKCKGITTPLVYHLTEWLLSHLFGKGLVYSKRFSEAVRPILTKHSEDESVVAKTFGNKFYKEAEHAVGLVKSKMGNATRVSDRVNQALNVTSFVSPNKVPNILLPVRYRKGNRSGGRWGMNSV